MVLTGASHVLLVDDDPDMHDAVRLMLEPCGYRVTACRTGEEAFAVLDGDPPDLLLLDVMLTTPTEGFEIAARVRARSNGAGVRIVLISSSARDTGLEEVRRRGLRLDSDEFMEKPLEAGVLRAAVARALARRGDAS